MKILFSTDGSEISLFSLENVSKYVKEATVDTICVIDWSFLPETMNIEATNYSKAYESIADSILVFAQNAIIEKGFEVGNKIKTVGSAVEGVLEQIEAEKYDLVLLGSHGKKGLQKWLGSVSRQVVSNTDAPVFISKKQTAGKKVLLTVDGSDYSYNAIKRAVDIFDFSEKEIHIVSVKENPELLPLEATLDKNWLDDIEKQQKIHAIKAINHAKSLLEKFDLKVQSEIILTGNPAQKIIEFANSNDVDLIVMGARSKKDLSSFLLGSVSKRVLENVHSDVLILRK